MTAKSSTERMREKRARDKLKTEERHAALLAYHLNTPVFKGTAASLERVMTVAGLDERDDAITRMIHAFDRMDEGQATELLKNP